MVFSIKDTADLVGVSIRTLHYYDEIGLLTPRKDPQNGYRYYSEEDISRLEQILFFRELEFSLHEISDILAHPEYDISFALKKQSILLRKKRDHLDRLINMINELVEETSEENMEMNETELKQRYAEEARERWGATEAYKESQRRTKKYTEEDEIRIQKEADAIFDAFAEYRGTAPDDPKVQLLVKDWQDHISRYYYHCTKEILKGLGQMYVADERFQKNIDRHGDGTAALMSAAIAYYCKYQND